MILIGHMRAAVVAGVDVVHTRLYRLAENGNGGVNVTWRPKTTGPTSCIAP